MVIILIFIPILLIAFYFRETKFVIDLVGRTVVEVEKEFNTKKGQEKLEIAVARIRKELPPYLSIFITKSKLIDIIEFVLNIVNDAFGLDYKVDIKGNEDDISIVLNHDKNYSIDLGYQTNKNYTNSDSDFNIYGKIKAETDFKGRNNASIEVGFQKKF